MVRVFADACLGGEDVNVNGVFDAGETNPNDEDTDDGGVNDGEEIARGTDPTMTSDDPATDCACTTAHGTGGARASTLGLLLALGLALGLRRRR